MTIRRSILVLALALALPACGGGLGGVSSGGGGGGSGSGTLSILADGNTQLFVNSTYVGERSAVVSRSPGTYSVTGVHGTYGTICWQVSARVDAGKTTRVTRTGQCGFVSTP